MDKYGFIAGQSVYAYSKALQLSDGEIREQWISLADFSDKVSRTRGDMIKSLKKVVMIDYGVFEQGEWNDPVVVKRRINDIINAQQLVEDEAYGVHFVVYTCISQLYNGLLTHFERYPEERYDGLHVELSSSNTYTVKGLEHTFEKMVAPIRRTGDDRGSRRDELMGYSQPNYQDVERRRQELEEVKRMYRVLGAIEELTKQRKDLDKKIEIMQHQLTEQLVSAKTESMAQGSDTLDDGSLLTDIQSEIQNFIK